MLRRLAVNHQPRIWRAVEVDDGRCVRRPYGPGSDATATGQRQSQSWGMVQIVAGWHPSEPGENPGGASAG